jgi:hypothetical protein
MSRIFAAVLAALIVLSALSLRAQSQPQRSTYPIAEAPAQWQPAIRHGDLIILSLHSALISELRRDLETGGVTAALASCHIDLTNAVYRAAREEGIAAGRTSARLRNPTNVPPPWAAAIVAAHPNEPSKGLDGFAVDLGTRIGLLRPIREQAMCAACHGPEQMLDGVVRKELKDRYPSDRATGFHEGDLRGWFWVELPKRATE